MSNAMETDGSSKSCNNYWTHSVFHFVFFYPCQLKGLFTIFLFLVRSHILNSNGVWYWWFCPEGPKNAQNSRFLGFYFVPRGPWLAAPHGTSTRSAGDLDSQRRGPRLAAPRDLNWRCESTENKKIVNNPFKENKTSKNLFSSNSLFTNYLKNALSLLVFRSIRCHVGQHLEMFGFVKCSLDSIHKYNG